MPTRSRERSRLLIAGVCLALAVGCSAAPPPVLEPLRQQSTRNPVVLVPGMTGSILRDAETGKILWGKGKNLLRPKDGGYSLALPLDTEDAAVRVVPAGVIEVMKLFGGLVRRPIYRPVIDLLEANGYVRGDLERPNASADFFLFDYDWRLDNPTSARRLGELLDGVRRARGVPSLDFDLICQSNGAHVCRFFAKYGGLSLEEAEAGAARRPAAVGVGRMILVGSSNGGGLRNFKDVVRGRRYVPVAGRRFRPETVFSFPPLYYDMPAYRDDLFVDAEGQPLEVSLYDAAAWTLHGWSMFDPAAEKRVERRGREDLFEADRAARLAYLERVLDEARRFQTLLLADAPGFGATRYYLIQSLDRDTPERAALWRDGASWATRFTGDKEVERDAVLKDAVTARGDGQATRASQLWMSPQEHGAVAAEPFYIDADHFEMILEPAAQERMLGFLLDGGGR